jgi:hypothetical protein
VVLTKTGDVYRPALTIERVSPALVRLRWPTNDPGFRLQFDTNLNGASLGTWAFVSETPVITGANSVVTNNASDPRKFYRLFKP